MVAFNKKLDRFGTKLIGKYVQKIDKMTQFQITQLVVKEIATLRIKGIDGLSDGEEDDSYS